jgi:heme-degrading monooxygenase HmoA
MYAAVVRVAVDPTANSEESIAAIQSQVIPRVRQAPGVISGRWFAPVEGGTEGFSIIFFETREQAEAMAPSVPEHPAPGVTRLSVEVREVIAGF